MYLEIIYKIWRFFVRSIITIAGIVVVSGVIVFGALQLPASKNLIKSYLVDEFNHQYQGQLSIDRLEGTLPLNFRFVEVELHGPRKEAIISGDSLVHAEAVNVSLDVWELLYGSLSVSELGISAPDVYLRWLSDGKLSVSDVFKLNNPRARDTRPFWENREVWAPNISITDGTIRFDQRLLSEPAFNLPEEFELDSLSANIFLEMNPQQRILEFESLQFKVPWMQDDMVAVTGQLYNDETVLEMNALTVESGDNRISLTGSLDSLDVYKPNIRKQLSESSYNVKLEGRFQNIDSWTYRFFGNSYSVSQPLTLNIHASGRSDSVTLRSGHLAYNESIVRLDGEINGVSDSELMDFDLNIDSSKVLPADLLPLFDGNRRWRALIQDWPVTQVAGNLNSKNKHLEGDLNLNSRQGDLRISLDAEKKDQWIYNSAFYVRNADLGSVFAGYIDTTQINADLALEGDGWNWRSGIYDLKADVFNSSLGTKAIDRLTFSAQMLDGYVNHSLRYEAAEELVTVEGSADLSASDVEWDVQGEAKQFRPGPWIHNTWLDASVMNFVFNFDLEGIQLDSLSGKGSIDVDSSIVNGQIVEPHQLYADLGWLNDNQRELRVTSSLADLNVRGNLDIEALSRYGEYWEDYLVHQWKKEIARLPDSLIHSPQRPDAKMRQQGRISLDVKAALKEPGLLKKYWPKGPSINAEAFSFLATVNADTSSLDIESRAQANLFEVDTTISISMPNYRFSASFDHGSSLRNSVRLDLRTRFENGILNGSRYENGALDFAMTQDTISYKHNIQKEPGNIRFNIEASARLEEKQTRLWFTNLFLGSDKYAWGLRDTGLMAYRDDQSFAFEEFSLVNGEQSFSISGVLSGKPDHSLEYKFKEVRLEQISDLIDGKVDFQGILNGSILTHTLTRTPYVQGNINVNRLAINERILGDLQFTSNYNPLMDRFNTSLRIFTDTTKYDLSTQEGFNQGQQVYVDGFFKYPQNISPNDTLYQFDVNIEQADAWIVAEILPNIFESIEGQMRGSGRITGNFNDINYDISLATSELYNKPVFLETDYWMTGQVHLNNKKGIVLDSLSIDDRKGGSGLLYGSIDMNEFNPVKQLNLTMELNELQFLNNGYSEDVPFYGSVAGSGTIKLTGENVDPYIRTVNPINISSNSVISIPLLEETEFEQNNKFIRFVNSFSTQSDSLAGSLAIAEDGNNSGSYNQASLASDNGEQNQNVESPSDQSFSELFSLDLQFTAQQNSQVRLIFDRVTGEILTAQGAGQATITLEDEEVQMYGDFRIREGEYQFVSGDIFRRRFYLQNGGSIVWEGPIDNARLNIDAVYRARPDISVLLPTANRQNQISQRVPIELLLQITGNIESIENSFSFRLPSEIDISRGDIALQNVINQLNNSGNKLIQATSLLLTDSFIPVSETGNVSNQELTSSLQRTSGTSIVVSPLLSNQINTLLNDMILASDVDVNLNVNNISELDQIDLGIALRLFNDRVVLSGQGQVTGERRNLEDIGATVRLNQAFSVKAFHRLDPTLLTSVTNQTQTNQQYLNGIGLEARFQFNTWSDFKQKVSDAFRNLFSISSEGRREEKEEKKMAENSSDGIKEQ